MAEITQMRMSAAEFAQLPESTTPTELIHGEVIVSPSPSTTHQRIVLRLTQLMARISHRGEVLIAPLDVYLDENNVVQPDVFWVGPESICSLQEDGYWHGAPDLIIEVISPGSSRMDKVTKFNLYEQHGVREYWLADPETQSLEVWIRGTDNRFIRQGAYTQTFSSSLLDGSMIDLSDVF
jgi:Uma2 family endonuclease